MEGVQQGPNGQKQGWSLTPSPSAMDLGEHCKLRQQGRGQSPGRTTFSYIYSALDGVSSCILGAFCSKKLYTVHHRKGSVMFLEAMWNRTVTVHRC